jgi:hypothetical protein
MKTNKETQKKLQQFLSIMEQQVISYPYQSYANLWSSQEETSMLRKVELMPEEQVAQQWDVRWLDWLIEVDATHLVCVFTRPGHTVSQSFMVEKLQGMKELRHQSIEVLLLGLERAEVDVSIRWEMLMNLLEHKRNSSFYVFEGHLLEYLYQLPFAFQDRLAAIMPNYRYTAREQLQYIWNTMEDKKQEAYAIDSV